MARRLATSTVLTAVLLAGLGCHHRKVKVEETPIEVLSDQPGRGRVAENGRVVYIDYEVNLPDGKTVLKHKDWRFVVGQGAVVEGMDEAVVGMRAGGRRVVRCPPHKHWGRKGYANEIPPNTWLTFDIKLDRVE